MAQSDSWCFVLSTTHPLEAAPLNGCRVVRQHTNHNYNRTRKSRINVVRCQVLYTPNPENTLLGGGGGINLRWEGMRFLLRGGFKIYIPTLLQEMPYGQKWEEGRGLYILSPLDATKNPHTQGQAQQQPHPTQDLVKDETNKRISVVQVPKPGCFKPGALLRPFALFCGLAFALSCAHLRSFANICVFLRPTAFRTTAFGELQRVVQVQDGKMSSTPNLSEVGLESKSTPQ